jgi:hypothetical protein
LADTETALGSKFELCSWSHQAVVVWFSAELGEKGITCEHCNIEICFALGCNSIIRHNTKGYFGTGESFVFSLAPGSTCYEWIAAVQMKERKQRMDKVRFD